MYLVHDTKNGFLVFTHEAPRKGGYTGVVEPDVHLDYPIEVHEWPNGSPRPEIVVGTRDPGRKEYRVFRSAKDCRQAGYKLVPGTPLVFRTWLDYTLRLIWDESLQELPKWVEVEPGAIPAWNTLPHSEKKQVAQRVDLLQRHLPPEDWTEDEARRLKTAEATYLARVNPSLLFVFRAEEGGRRFVIENFLRQETLDRYFVSSKAPLGQA